MDKLTYAGNLQNLEDIASDYDQRYVFEKVDICDAKNGKYFFEVSKTRFVILQLNHTLIDQLKTPENFIQTNIVGTFNLLELSKSHRDLFKIFHHVSTDEVYGSLGLKDIFLKIPLSSQQPLFGV